MRHKIKQVVHHLRSKPEPVKQQILSVSMAVVGVILVFLWLGTFGNGTPKKQKEDILTDAEVAPFTLLKNNFFKTLRTVSSGVSSVRGSFKKDDTTTPDVSAGQQTDTMTTTQQ